MSQRFGIKHMAVLSALVSAALIIAPATVKSEDKEKAKDKAPGSAKAAFDRLKTLAGTWKSDVSEAEHKGHDAENKVTYRLTGAGSALVETVFPDSDHEMISVYHLDGDDLRMTHYCAIGNQPRLKLDRAASTPDKLVFVFDGGTNLDPSKDMHIHGLVMTFQKDGVVDSAWNSQAGGKNAGTIHFKLSRAQH
jgi:hypothetical protein